MAKRPVLHILSDHDMRHLARIVRKVDGARGPGVKNSPSDLTFAPPPPSRPSAATPALAVSWPVRIVSHLGFGVYDAIRGSWSRENFDPGAQFTMDAVSDFTNHVPCYLWNQAESAIATHRIADAVIVPAFPTPLPTDVSRQVLWVNYATSIRFIRFNEVSGWLQVTYNQAASAEDVPESDWVNVVQFTACPDGAAQITTTPVSLSDDFFTTIASAVSSPQTSVEHTELLQGILESLDGIRLSLLNQ